ncbi:hypothetical protein [Sphingomonas flavalba]|uniref:hypothetical protein n=1 Tax=Sphingomonas flavalba TaxID=2559804 RepID=UPI00109E0691|nr:hypothetical protein [Sphingomonas flavalba]
MTRLLLLLIVPLALPGCVARTAANVVTLPVRAVGQTADWMTTSQDEADRNRGREIRKQEKREARERRRAEKQATRRPH